jgi:ectoine hydroxylase-related dioxygenase (phytanoyl-CoA dioxygenase family)
MLNITSDQTESLADTFDRLGVIHIPSLLSVHEVAEVREAFMAQIAVDASVGHDDQLAEGDALRLFPRVIHPHRHTELEIGRLSRRWMLDPRIMSKLTEIIGPVFGAQSMFYFKPAGGRGQAMHQDNLFLQAFPETCIAVWIAIDDCDAENGALEVVPGTHKFELQCLEAADENESFTNVEVKLPEGMVAQQTEMKAGDALIFHGSLVHGSGPNRSTDRFRRSLIFHYTPQSSTEIYKFYMPLLTPSGDEINLEESDDGGVCGEGWAPSGPH